MTKKRKKKKPLIKRDKYLLDTSLQIERLYAQDTEKEVRRLIQRGDIYSSYFVLYEFKAGLIQHIIEFYFVVKVSQDISLAKAYWANNFSQRGSKYIHILESLIFKNLDSISTKDTYTYLLVIEATIYHMLCNFYTDLKGLVGQFKDLEVSNFNLDSSDNYADFMALCERNKFVKLKVFFERNMDSLKKLIENEDLENATKYKKIYNGLVEIQNNLNKADTHNISKAVGDAVIAIDTPSDYTIAGLDASFNLLCKCINKTFIALPHSKEITGLRKSVAQAWKQEVAQKKL